MSPRLPYLLLCCLVLGACAPGQSALKATSRAHGHPERKFAVSQYRLGIDAYTNSRYAEAIQHWKLAQAGDPSLPKVDEYLERARRMLKKQDEIGAVAKND